MSTTEASLQYRASVRDPAICCKYSPKIKSEILPPQKGSGLEELLPLCLSHCGVPSKAAQPRLASPGDVNCPREVAVTHCHEDAAQNSQCVIALRLSQAPQQNGYNPLLPRNPCLGAWRTMVCNCPLKEHRDDS